MATENTSSLTTEANNIPDNKKKSSRSFKVKMDLNGHQYGRYNGDSPYQAANKALSEIIRNKVKQNQNADEEITFFLVESTKGSTKKIHEYTGKRTKLEVPVVYKVNNSQEIKKEYKNVLRKVKKAKVAQNTQNENPVNENPVNENTVNENHPVNN
jgi:hypothetical protein